MLYPAVAHAHALHQQLGRDAEGGRTLITEQEACLDREKVTEPWREFYRGLWRAEDQERGEFQREEWERLRRQRPGRKGGSLRTME